jgi:hypothetical protein
MKEAELTINSMRSNVYSPSLSRYSPASIATKILSLFASCSVL